MELPEAFVRYTREVMGEDRFARYLAAFDEETPVSIRLAHHQAHPRPLPKGGEVVPWCPLGYYLPERPNFTFDPLLHAGCYYVQEAASMFLYHILSELSHQSPLPWGGDGGGQGAGGRLSLFTLHSSLFTSLDLCAAPGGKSTLLRSLLPDDCILFSNEPVRNRAQVLLENVTKWGYPRHYVTNNYPRDYRRSKLKFDLILCDVPCSGEGMFRKDPQTVSEWSPQNVEKCWQLQRDIVSDAWACLNDGGLLIYSTCTFNTKENEENVRWMQQTFDAEILPVSVRPEWNIQGSLLPDFHAPVYRFIPGITRSEGLFVCVLRKGGSPSPSSRKHTHSLLSGPVPSAVAKLGLSLLEPPALHVDGPCVELTYQQAVAYLRRESLTLPPDAPRGLVEVTFHGHRLGTVKNLGSRANNLYPKEWRIKSTYVPQTYQPVIIE